MRTAAPSIGQTLGHYRIVEQIGAGGMGVVFRAHDEQLDRDVALKTLPQLGLLSEPARRQFRREALSLARITDPNVAMAFDFGRDNGIDYLITEYVPGLTLNTKIAGRPLPEGEVLQLGRQMASGLEAAHREGVIHRDLKPGNIRVTPEGKLKILDFGLAFLLHAEAGSSVTAPLSSTYSDAGTLPYMAPEQIKGVKPDARADVWSAGAVLFEMATGKHPFGDLSGTQLVGAILESEPPAPRTVNPKISEGLERVILRALRKDPQERYQSAGDLRIDLAGLATGTMPIYPKPATRRKWQTWVSAAVVLVALAGAGIWWLQVHRPGPVTAQMMAVLPFESVNNDASTNALGLGLTETVTTKLVQATDGGHLQLVSTRDLVAQGIKTADQARREFGTDLVLEGSLQQSGDRIRITCNLVDARTHVQYAAQEVTGGAGDIFALQDQLFDRVLDMLQKTALRVEPPRRQLIQSTTKSAAYDFYLRGRGYLEEYQNLDNLKNAIHEFEQAVSADQNYAPAYAAMGMAYTIGFQQKNQGREWLDKAKQECERALAITPQLAEGHTCLGDVYYSTGHYEEAIQQLQGSLDLDHTSDETLRLLATAYQKAGNVSAAEHAFQKAVSLRPNYWGVYNAFGAFYYQQARYKEAAEMFRKVTQLAPLNYRGHSNLGGIYLVLGEYGQAVDELQHSVNLRPTAESSGNLATAYYYLRRYDEAAANLKSALAIDDKDWANWGNLGDTLSQIPSRRAEAIAAYRKAIELSDARVQVNPRDANLLAYSAAFHAMVDSRDEAMALLSRALAASPNDADVLFRAAVIYNHFGDKEKTLEFLKKAADAGYSRIIIRDTPDFETLQSDRRFRALLPTS
jgi:tetratricopeptide (TPR) repeat protein